jgi:hypothetical protein
MPGGDRFVCDVFIPRPLILLPLLATAPAAEPTPPPAPPPVSPPGRIYSPELIAYIPASIALKHCLSLSQLDAGEFKRRDPRHREAWETPPAEKLKAEAAARAEAMKQLADAHLKLSIYSRDPKATTVTAPALALIAATKQLTPVHQELFALLDSGKAWASPETKAIVARAEIIAKVRDQELHRLMKELKRIKEEDEANTRKAAR